VDVNRNVLIPRPDTECIVEEVIKELSISQKSGKRILEIGTGSGIITIALARQFPLHTDFASDVSPKALTCAKANCKTWCPDSSVSFFSGNLFQPVSPICGVFDFIVSNPPYIPTDEIKALQREIREFEPVQALDGDSDGLSFIRSIIHSASVHLAPGGSLFLETGYDQREKTEKLAGETGLFSFVESVNDYGGNHRVVKMTKKSCSL